MRSMTFDSGLEHLFRGRLLVERRSLPMDRHVDLRVDRTKLVDRFAEHIEHAAQRLAAHRHMMPLPVSIAFIPRTMPSVATIAMQRTRPSPRCCCTSTTTSSGVGTVKPSLTMRSA